METFSYVSPQGSSLQGTFYPTSNVPLRPTIIYIHGGGLTYGNRDDIPMDYINLFNQSGYPLISLDYCLAPESNYSEILASLKSGVRYFLSHYGKWGILSDDYIFFGRSAGSYLAMQLISDEKLPSPKAFLSFYGFPNLDIPAFTKPSSHYQQYPTVSVETQQRLIKNHPLTQSTDKDRFLLYVFARQSGQWPQMVLGDVTPEPLSLNEFPPTYILQASSDPDVPFNNALQLKAHLQQAYLKVVSSNEHDFDRTVTAQNLKFYQDAINWLTFLK